MPHKVDIHVGQKLRQRRWLIGMTQQQLAEQIGIKFQQVQKYETGANRVSASRLWDISNAMDVPVSYFFEDIEIDDTANEAEKSDTSGRPPHDFMNDKSLMDLISTYYALPTRQRERLFDLARVLNDVA